MGTGDLDRQCSRRTFGAVTSPCTTVARLDDLPHQIPCAQSVFLAVISDMIGLNVEESRARELVLRCSGARDHLFPEITTRG